MFHTSKVVPPLHTQSTSPLAPFLPRQVSSALTLTGKQLDIMYAVSGCADVKGLVRNVMPEVRYDSGEKFGDHQCVYSPRGHRDKSSDT